MSCGAAAVSSFQSQERPQFRADVTAVPVAVRVLDSSGKPVMDLRPDDFVLRENGVVQTIAHFQVVRELDVIRDGRVFIIGLGRGRLNHPTGAIDAAVKFVTSNLHPTDRVGVVAYLRVIEPTVDHEAIARFLENYGKRHEGIESRIVRDGSRLIFPLPHTLEAETRRLIDTLFADRSLPMRDLPGSSGHAASRFNDHGYVRRALEYLRTIPGEKHFVLLSERRYTVGRPPEDKLRDYWSGLAAGALTTLSFIHTGGFVGNAPAAYRGRVVQRPLDATYQWALADQRIVAERTGGLSAAYERAERPLARLEQSTRSHYLLGYYPPANASSPDQLRAIQVSLSRSSAQLSYRHLYVAQAPPAAPEDDAAYRRVVSEARIAASLAELIDPPPPSIARIWWRMRLSATWPVVPAGDARTIRVVVAFDPMWASFTQDGEHSVTDMDLKVVADDSVRNVVGQQTVRVSVRLTPAEFARIKRGWLEYELSMDVTSLPAYLRAALYDFETDRTASAQLRLKQSQASPPGGHLR
jgi:VWFA-related protein